MQWFLLRTNIVKAKDRPTPSRSQHPLSGLPGARVFPGRKPNYEPTVTKLSGVLKNLSRGVNVKHECLGHSVGPRPEPESSFQGVRTDTVLVGAIGVGHERHPSPKPCQYCRRKVTQSGGRSGTRLFRRSSTYRKSVVGTLTTNGVKYLLVWFRSSPLQ